MASKNSMSSEFNKRWFKDKHGTPICILKFYIKIVLCDITDLHQNIKNILLIAYLFEICKHISKYHVYCIYTNKPSHKNQSILEK